MKFDVMILDNMKNEKLHNHYKLSTKKVLESVNLEIIESGEPALQTQ